MNSTDQKQPYCLAACKDQVCAASCDPPCKGTRCPASTSRQHQEQVGASPQLGASFCPKAAQFPGTSTELSFAVWDLFELEMQSRGGASGLWETCSHHPALAWGHQLTPQETLLLSKPPGAGSTRSSACPPRKDEIHTAPHLCSQLPAHALTESTRSYFQ